VTTARWGSPAAARRLEAPAAAAARRPGRIASAAYARCGLAGCSGPVDRARWGSRFRGAGRSRPGVGRSRGCPLRKPRGNGKTPALSKRASVDYALGRRRETRTLLGGVFFQLSCSKFGTASRLHCSRWCSVGCCRSRPLSKRRIARMLIGQRRLEQSLEGTFAFCTLHMGHDLDRACPFAGHLRQVRSSNVRSRSIASWYCGWRSNQASISFGLALAISSLLPMAIAISGSVLI